MRMLKSDQLAMTAANHKAVREFLAFHQEAGVDAVIGEMPVDRLADPMSAPSPTPPEPARPNAAPAAPATRTFFQNAAGSE